MQQGPENKPDGEGRIPDYQEFDASLRRSSFRDICEDLGSRSTTLSPEGIKLAEVLAGRVVNLLRASPLEERAALWTQLRSVFGETAEERSEYFDPGFGSESLAIKLVKTLERFVEQGRDLRETVAGLCEDRAQSRLIHIPTSEVAESLLRTFRLSPDQFKVVRGLTISDENSWVSRGKLGLTFAVLDPRLSMVLKLRVTEQINPVRGELEWNIGIVSRDTSKPSDDTRIPGTRHQTFAAMVGATQLESLRSFAQLHGVARIDPLPSLYFIYVALKRMGGHFDPEHPRYAEDKSRVELIEQQLDNMGIRGLREKTWAIHRGEVIDPSTGQPGLLWKNPRFVIDV